MVLITLSSNQITNVVKNYSNLQAKDILKEGRTSELQDPELVNAHNQEQFEIMVSAATLCTRHAPQSHPDISLVSTN